MSELFPVVILAGGLATRLKPLTEKIPKSLIDINGEPFIAHQLRSLSKNHFRRVVICIGFLGEQIIDYVGDGSRFGLHVSYAQDGDKLLGTGGAIKNAMPSLTDNFFVLYGDSYLSCNFNAIQNAFIQSNQLALMTVFKNNGLWDVSNIEFSAGKIIAYDKIHQTESMTYIDYGLGVMTQKALDFIPSEQPYDLAHLYQTLLKQNQLAAYEVTHRFYEVGSLAGINELQDYLS